MKICLLISLLLLSTHLLHEAQGIRLGKESILARHDHEFQKEDTGLVQTSNAGVIGEVVLCKDGHCSGMNRKLMTKTTSTPSSKNQKNGGKQGDHPKQNGTNEGQGGKKENFAVKYSSPVSEHPEAAPESYPDVLDLAGMDYSPARRKSPIHN